MKQNIVKKLINSHFNDNDDDFIKYILQLAASEDKSGHNKIASDIKAAVSEILELRKNSSINTPQTVNIFQPKDDLDGLLHVEFCNERLKDIILHENLEFEINKVLKENQFKSEFQKWGVSPSRKLLFYGPPGCGKTMTARVIAGELGLPLLTVKFNALISKYLGATANQLKAIFDEMPKRNGVYLFDEFDTIGKHRQDNQEVGEIKRVVTSFLQLLDSDQNQSIIIAATNYEAALDKALFRRFDEVCEFELPTKEDIKNLIKIRLGFFNIPEVTIKRVVNKSQNLSFADIARGCDNSVKNMIMNKRKKIKDDDLIVSFEQINKRFRGN